MNKQIAVIISDNTKIIKTVNIFQISSKNIVERFTDKKVIVFINVKI